MPIETATLEARLTEAENALHTLLLGQTVTVVSYDGHRTEFKPADEGKLRRYVQELKRKLGQAPAGRMSRRVVF